MHPLLLPNCYILLEHQRSLDVKEIFTKKKKKTLFHSILNSKRNRSFLKTPHYQVGICASQSNYIFLYKSIYGILLALVLSHYIFFPFWAIPHNGLTEGDY